jgi:hypothetical protein
MEGSSCRAIAIGLWGYRESSHRAIADGPSLIRPRVICRDNATGLRLAGIILARSGRRRPRGRDEQEAQSMGAGPEAATRGTETSLAEPLRQTWRTSHRVTVFLVEHLPAHLWSLPVPGNPRRTVRSILGHLHNDRCRWVTMIGRRDRVDAPDRVDLRRVTPSALLGAPDRSSAVVLRVLDKGLENGGALPRIAWSCSARRPPLLRVARGPRGPPPRSDRHARARVRAPASRRRDHRPVAVDEALPGGWTRVSEHSVLLAA